MVSVDRRNHGSLAGSSSYIDVSKFAVTEEFGDLLEYPASIIVHQCNMRSTHAQGFARLLFQRYPEVDVYQSRGEVQQELGNIVMTETNDGKLVCNLYGQDEPGRNNESKQQRLKWFRSGLLRLYIYIRDTKKEEEAQNGRSITSVAFPGNIGCGLGGGEWSEYRRAIQVFAALVRERNVGVAIIWRR